MATMDVMIWDRLSGPLAKATAPEAGASRALPQVPKPTVEPGPSWRPLSPSVMDALRDLAADQGLELRVQFDGGVVLRRPIDVTVDLAINQPDDGLTPTERLRRSLQRSLSCAMISPAPAAASPPTAAGPPPAAPSGAQPGVCQHPTCQMPSPTFRDRFTGELLCEGCAGDRNRRARSLHGSGVEPYCAPIPAETPAAPASETQHWDLVLDRWA